MKKIIGLLIGLFLATPSLAQQTSDPAVINRLDHIITVVDQKAGVPPVPALPSYDGTKVTGQAQPGSLVEVLADDTISLGTTKALADGSYSLDVYEAASNLKDTHKLSSKQGVLVSSLANDGVQVSLPHVREWINFSKHPTLSIDAPSSKFLVAPGSTSVFLKIKLSYSPINTVYFHIFLANGNEPGKLLYQGANFNQVNATKLYVFRPGDDPEMVIQVPIFNIKASNVGGSLTVNFLEIRGANNPSGSSITAKVVVDPNGLDGIAPTVAYQHRAPEIYLSDANPTTVLDIANMQWGNNGLFNGAPAWSTDLGPNQREQPGNGENGVYGDSSVIAGFPTVLVKESDGEGGTLLRLKSLKLDNQVTWKNVIYPYGSSVIEARKLPEWRHLTGTWAFDITVPNRKCSFPAIWFMAAYPNGQPIWPPEIDGYEGFNNKTSFNSATSISGNVHFDVFGHGGVGPYSGQNDDIINLVGLGFPTTTDLSKQKHTLEIRIDDNYITWFWDHIETLKKPNYFQADMKRLGLEWYPIINSSVGANFICHPTTYDDGSGDVLLYGARYYTIH